jgi:DNA-directed RNA polymerase specialized sigma24 family protein
MECARLSDADLLRLVRAGGEPAHAALQELERRHFQAVRVYAAACVGSSSAADALAGQAWQHALRPQDGSASGAVRPRALAYVLRTAVAWSRTGQRDVLASELIDWVDACVPAPPAPEPIVDATGVTTPEASGAPADLPGSVAARAFDGLSDRSQTVLWHRAVERDETETVAEILGPDAESVPLLERRARSELYTSYTQLHQAGMDDACRPYHRMVLAYAEEKSIDKAADLAPHLESCASCSRTVADLGRMRADCAAFLAEAVLPWGGTGYLAVRAENEAPVGNALELLASGGQLVHLTGAAERPEGRFGRLIGRRTPRATRVVQSLAAVGLASVVAGFAVTGDFGSGAPQSSEVLPTSTAKPEQPSPTPDPRPSKTRKPTKTAKPSPSKKPPSSKPPSKPPASRPPVRGAELEWLFNGNGSSVADTSGNGNAGVFAGGAALGGQAQFGGEQAAVANGPVIDTENSFTVSARVTLNDLDDFHAVISQDADQSSGFMLQYDDEDRWEMRIPLEDEEDTSEADADEASSDFGAEPGVPTHLVGVYDDEDDEIRLYVDGELVGTDSHDSDFASNGDFAVGRGLSGGDPFRGLRGSVDDVRAFNRALNDRQAAALFREDRG